MALFSPAWWQRRMWNERAHAWDEHVGLERVVDAVLGAAKAPQGVVAVDLGCGTGILTLALARTALTVTAVDVSEDMVERLSAKAASSKLENVVSVVAPIERFDMPPSSVDLVVSNYALHHLRDRDKRRLACKVAGWLRPGGRFVVGDMMFGRTMTGRDGAIIRSKVVTLARRGPRGWWRVLKNVGRFTFRFQERPVPMETWRRYLEESGLTDVSVRPVVAEAGVVVGTKAGQAAPRPAGSLGI